jgi:preprotein translocase subunit SecA
MFTENLKEDSYENHMLSNAVTNAQKQIEGKNFDTRKNLKDYDDVLAKQRDIIYKKRDSILMAEDIVNLIHDFFKACGGFLAKKAVDANSAEGLVSGEQLKKLVEPRFLPEGSLNAAAYDGAPAEEAGEDLGELLYANYLEKRKTWPAADADMVERQIALHVIDHNWQGHIDTMAHLREGISLRSYAQTNPLQDYVNEGYDLFREMNEKVAVDTAFNLLNVRLIRKSKPRRRKNRSL